MTIQDLNSAIQTCNQGLLQFNIGNVRAFLYKNHWYPLRAIVNNARNEAGEEELTSDRGLVELAYLLSYIKVEDKEFNNNFPIKIDNQNRLVEINYLANLITELTN